MKLGFSSIIVESKQKDLILPDNLIIHCILDHARRHPAASKADAKEERGQDKRIAAVLEA